MASEDDWSAEDGEDDVPSEADEFVEDDEKISDDPDDEDAFVSEDNGSVTGSEDDDIATGSGDDIAGPSRLARDGYNPLRQQAKANWRKANQQNVLSARWSREHVELLWQKRKIERKRFVTIVKDDLPMYTRHALSSKYHAIEFDDEGNPILPEDGEMPRPKKTFATKLNARTARVMTACAMEVREKAPLFAQLQQEDFSSFRDVLEDLHDAARVGAMNKGAGRYVCVPLPLLSALSWNDRLSRNPGAVGKFRFGSAPNGHDMVYLADRMWTREEQNEWLAATPPERLHWSGTYIHWQWADPRTLVLPIMIVEANNRGTFDLELTEGQWNAAIGGGYHGPCLLLVSGTHVYFTSIAEMVQCRPGSGEDSGKRGKLTHAAKMKIVTHTGKPAAKRRRMGRNKVKGRAKGKGKKAQKAQMTLNDNAEGLADVPAEPTTNRATRQILINWDLYTSQDSLWYQRGQALSQDSEDFDAQVISRLLSAHTTLRDKGGIAYGVGLSDWGDELEVMLEGE